MPNLTDTTTFEEVWDTIEEKYFWCFVRTKEKFKGLLSEEAPLQSACATIWINATKEVSTVAELNRKLKARIAKLNEEAIPSAIQVWEWHFRDFISEFGPRIKGQIAYYVSQNTPPEIIERDIRERAYHLRCEKLNTIAEQNDLAVEMFGKEVLGDD